MSVVARASKPVTVTLGPLAERAQRLVSEGRYASLSEVVRAGLRALEREEDAVDAALKERIRLALDDPFPSLAQDEVFAALRAHHNADA